MEYRVQTNPVVRVTVTSSVTSLASENRFNRELTIGALKCKLELVTGAAATAMDLEVYTEDNVRVCSLNDDNAMLGSYPVDDNMRIHVIDRRGKQIELEDVSKVEKYEMSGDAYAQREDSVRAFKERMKVGRFKEVDPEEQARKEQEKHRLEEEEKQKANSIKTGDRIVQKPDSLAGRPSDVIEHVLKTVTAIRHEMDVDWLQRKSSAVPNFALQLFDERRPLSISQLCEVSVAGQPTKRATVRYVGLTNFKPGYWVGVQYDEPRGKHDGCVEGKRYFECLPKYGAFVRPTQVTVGNFPELGLDDDDMEM